MRRLAAIVALLLVALSCLAVREAFQRRDVPGIRVLSATLSRDGAADVIRVRLRNETWQRVESVRLECSGRWFRVTMAREVQLKPGAEGDVELRPNLSEFGRVEGPVDVRVVE